MTTETSLDTAAAKDTTTSGGGSQARDQGQQARGQDKTQAPAGADAAQDRTQNGPESQAQKDQTTRDEKARSATDQRGLQTQGQNQNPEEQKSAGQNPDGQKQADHKPTDQKQADRKLGDQNPADQKPGDQKQADLPTGQNPADQKPADYTLDLHQGAKADALTKWFEAKAKGAGMSKDQAQAVYDGWMALSREAAFLGQKNREQAENQLKAEWQADYQANLALAGKAARQVGGQELLNLLRKTGLGANPVMIRAWHRIGKALSEDAFVHGGSGAAAQNASPAERIYPNTDKK